MGVVGRVLEVPLHLAGVRVQGQHRTGEQVVAGAQVTVPVRGRIAGGPVKQVELGVEGAGQPGGAAAGLPGITLPGFAAGLARGRHRIGAPQQFATVGIISIDIGPHARFSATHPDDDLAVQGQGRQGQGKAHGIIRHGGLPAHGTGAGIQGEQPGIQGGHVHLVIQQGHATVDPGKADVQHVIGDVRHEVPQHPAGTGIQRRHAAGGFGEIHDIARHQGRGFLQARAADIGRLHLVGPHHLELVHVAGVDLAQG